MYYPDEADFERLPFEPEHFDTHADVCNLRDWFREHREELGVRHSLSFVNWLVRFLGLRRGTCILWDGEPFVVTDDANVSRHVWIRRIPGGDDRPVEDFDRLFLDWLSGDVVPAVPTGDWVERRDEGLKTYGLFGRDPNDPRGVSLLFGGPVTVDTSKRNRAERIDAVRNAVREEYDITLDVPNDVLFVAELSDFPC